jgi:phosphoglycolate phosphatase
VGNGVGLLITRSIPCGQDNPQFAACLDAFCAYYAEHNRVITNPYDGIVALLNALREQGVRIGVVSNKFDSAVKALCQDYFGKLVEVAIGERDGVRRKPHPDSLFAAMDALGVSPQECLYVGDSETDVESAKNAGINCLSVLWGFRDKETLTNAGATHFVSTPAEILNCI